jgi:glucokinase
MSTTTGDAPLLGIEIGGTKLQIVAGDAEGRIRRRWRATVDRAKGGPGICNQITQGLPQLLDDAGRTSRPLAVGVGFGGPVDWRAGRVKCSHQIEGWEDFDLAGWLEGVAGVPVALENDANVGALGESACGAGREAGADGADPLFFTTLGSGVGGGLVAGGRIYHGAPPGEAEFGHMRLDRGGATVESRCSGWAVDARIRRLCREDPDTLLARSIGDRPAGGEARHLSAALAAGDPAARRVLAEVAGDLGFAFSHVVHLFHPRMIVLGGGLALVGEALRAAVDEVLRGYVMDAFRPGPAVRLAALGEDAIPAGALVLAGQRAARGGV